MPSMVRLTAGDRRRGRGGRDDAALRLVRIDDAEQVEEPPAPRGRYRPTRRSPRAVNPINVQAARLLAHQFLAGRNQFTLAEIAAATGVSLATAYRDQEKVQVIERIGRERRDDD
jgi:hypothetical protein